MELRMLEYFLAVAREQNITAAAESLHISQPALSTQLKAMETELGKQLLIRGVKGSRKVLLTEEGMILRKRAEEILSLVRRTEEEITGPGETIAGNVYIGTGETEVMRLLAHAATNVQRQHPDIRYNILSGNAEYVFECLDKGLIDFGLVFKKVDLQKYEAFPMSVKDTWGGTDAKRFAAGGEGVYLFGRPVGQAAHRLPSKGRRPLPRTLAAKKRRRPAHRSHIQPCVQRIPPGRRRAWICAVLRQADQYTGHEPMFPALLSTVGCLWVYHLEKVSGILQGSKCVFAGVARCCRYKLSAATSFYE